MTKKKQSTSATPLSNPVFIKPGSVEETLLDPVFGNYRITGAVPEKTSIRTAIPKPGVSGNQFNEQNKLTTIDKVISDIPPQLMAIQLDDITISDGPTSYMDGSNKKYEITFKINNPGRLLVKDVEYRIAEAKQ